MKHLLLITLLCLAANAQTLNYSGFGDTAKITGLVADTLKYSKAFPLSAFEEMAAIAMSNDTTATGFGDDSIVYVWGIQCGDIVLNANGKIDTTWRPIATADTLDTMDMTAPDDIDTTYVTGFAVQDRSVTPKWAVLIRCWCKGLTGSPIETPLKQRFALVRREYVPVRSR